MFAKESDEKKKGFQAERIGKRYNPKFFGCDFLDTEYEGARQNEPFEAPIEMPILYL
ncbi:MAG: hypothetical protein JRJ44_05740 [Deltaproteobacteria bacterium]|nr:hypothetical protein [Deltaproteobacteria bacterium]